MKIVHKRQVECYKVRNKGTSSGWANFNCEWGDESVHVMIDSDYGSYSYYWSHCGQDPKAFLISLERMYAMEKLNNYNYFEFDETQLDAELKSIILYTRREYYDSFTKEMARDAWDTLLGIYDGSKDLYYEKLFEYEHFEELFGDSEGLPHPRRVIPKLVTFWDECWIPFTQALQEELDSEKSSDSYISN